MKIVFFLVIASVALAHASSASSVYECSQQKTEAGAGVRQLLIVSDDFIEFGTSPDDTDPAPLGEKVNSLDYPNLRIYRFISDYSFFIGLSPNLVRTNSHKIQIPTDAKSGEITVFINQDGFNFQVKETCINLNALPGRQ